MLDEGKAYNQGYDDATKDLELKWIPITQNPNVKSGKFIGINKGLEYPSPIIVGYHSVYNPNWTDYYTEDEVFITHYIQCPK